MLDPPNKAPRVLFVDVVPSPPKRPPCVEVPAGLPKVLVLELVVLDPKRPPD